MHASGLKAVRRRATSPSKYRQHDEKVATKTDESPWLVGFRQASTIEPISNAANRLTRDVRARGAIRKGWGAR